VTTGYYVGYCSYTAFPLSQKSTTGQRHSLDIELHLVWLASSSDKGRLPLSHLARRLTNPVVTNAMNLPLGTNFIILRTGWIVLCLLLNKFYKVKKKIAEKRNLNITLDEMVKETMEYLLDGIST